MYSPIQPERLYEQIVEQIEQQILTGVLKVGDRLPPERELAEQFRVSRTAVREAVKTLREKGWVEAHPGRGTFITNGIGRSASQSLERLMKLGSTDSFADLLELRGLIEPAMAALAAVRATEEHVASLRAAVATMDASMQDMEAYIHADNQFHQAIAQATYNRLIRSLLDPIVDLLDEQRKKIFALERGPVNGQIHHKQILEAIVRRDPEAARKAMQAHLDQVVEDIREADVSPQRLES